MLGRKNNKDKKEKKIPNEVTCKCCGKKVKAIIGINPYCRKHDGFVHHNCFVSEFNQCINCWNN